MMQKNNLFATYTNPSPDNTVLIGKQLPISSFVGFNTFKLKKAELVWVNNKLVEEFGEDGSKTCSEKNILENFSYVSEGYAAPDKIDSSDNKIFLADRYGSRYEACNGGSARCGINGQFQVKGIGRNPLVSINIDDHHAHGKLCLAEAVNEAIWGEICHQQLPYGAVRTLAIIKTNAAIESDYGVGEAVLQPCALAIRQAAVRPAHFERATFFWPHDQHIHLRDDDHIRVREAISYLTQAFGIDHEAQCALPFANHYAFGALMQFVKRIAKQIGTARIKGIPHGSLTSSNISADGRFLDFGTISAVPDFANYILAAGQGGIWDDHLLIVEWIRHLFFFVNKYSAYALSKEMQDYIIETFLNELERTENIETAKMIGMAPNDVQRIGQQTGARLKRILRANNTEPRPFTGFGGKRFSDEIDRAAQIMGVKQLKPDLGLRTIRYSQHTIATKTAQVTQYGNGDRNAITTLIEEYIE